jgi:hypothetical protein
MWGDGRQPFYAHHNGLMLVVEMDIALAVFGGRGNFVDMLPDEESG